MLILWWNNLPCFCSSHINLGLEVVNTVGVVILRWRLRSFVGRNRFEVEVLHRGCAAGPFKEAGKEAQGLTNINAD